jgi:hypothetical protein
MKGFGTFIPAGDININFLILSGNSFVKAPATAPYY